MRRLIHVVDWVPTLLSSVKSKLPNKEQFKIEELLSKEYEGDGMDLWNMFITDEPSKRTELLYNIDPEYDDEGVKGRSAIR